MEKVIALVWGSGDAESGDELRHQLIEDTLPRIHRGGARAATFNVHDTAAASPFGRFAYATDRAELWVEHAVLGDDLDPIELETAIDAVAALSDGEDDRLQAAHGGRRYADLSG